nr:SH3 domain-containing kinase-binding protein 1-like isoform X2 [Taeniopygia guttata]
MEPTKLPLTKRMAPAPPVPAKTKPAPVLPTKPGDPQPSTSAAVEWGRAGDPDANGFNTVPVTTARLSHPTATRPRVPGQRPPSMVLGSTGGPHGGEQPQGLPRAALCAPVPSTGQAPVPPWSTEGLEVLEGRLLALEDLKAEVRTLHILVDLMRVQHLRDLQDLRQELCQEQAQRQALQVSPCRGLPRPGVPCAPQQSQPLPTGGDRASEEGAALLAWGAAVPTHGTGQGGGTWLRVPPQPGSAPVGYKCPPHTQALLLEA